MKLLIIAGPYEADRIRKAAQSAGFETLAVEPGESLSGWITASRPELIIMAPQIVHPDPALALAKVRAVPRGRVPIFFVGDAAEESRMRGLSDGFFVRPIAPEQLLERARALLAPGGRPRVIDDLERTEMGVGPNAASASGRGASDGAPERAPLGKKSKSGPQPGRPSLALKPLVAAALGSAQSAPVRAAEPGALLAELGAGIDALLDAELAAAIAQAPRVLPAPPADFAGEATRKVDPSMLMQTAPLRVRRSPPAEAPAAVAAPPRPPDEARARVLARHAPVEEGDYFAVLGVGRDANVLDLRRAHDEILRETEPERLDPQLAQELAPELEAIRVVAGEALRVLTDDQLRPRYVAHLADDAGTV